MTDTFSEEAKAWFKDHGVGPADGAEPAIATKPTAHARLGFSGAERWMTCAGSPAACEGLPDRVTEYAREGSAAHEVAAICLTEGREPIEFLDREIDLGDGCRKITVDDEMVESLDFYLTLIAEESGYGFDPDVEMVVEHRGNIEKLDPAFFAIEPIFGTCDVRILRRNLRRLTIIDLKYGRGVLVEVKGKPQTRGYAVMELISDALENEVIDEIELVICQPRAFHKDGPVRREIISVDELMRWAMEDMLPAAKRTREPNAPLVAGDHCLFCRAAPHCVELRRQALTAAMVKFEEPDVLPGQYPVLPDPKTLTPEQLSQVLTLMPLALQFFSSAREYALGLMNAGVAVPHHKLVASRRGRRKWVGTDEETAMSLVIDYGLPEKELWAPRELKSPAQVDKVLKQVVGTRWRTTGAKIAEAGLHATKPPGFTIAPEDDSREGLTGVDINGFEALDE